MQALMEKRCAVEAQISTLQSKIIDHTISTEPEIGTENDEGRIIEQVKTFATLNSQMEQLMQLEHELLRAVEQQKRLLQARGHAQRAPSPQEPPSALHKFAGTPSPSLSEDRNIYAHRNSDSYSHRRISPTNDRVPVRRRRTNHGPGVRRHVDVVRRGAGTNSVGVRRGRDIAAATRRRGREVSELVSLFAQLS